MGEAQTSLYDRMLAKAGEIETELKRIGYWQSQPLKPEAYQFKQAFAADTMAFPQWLQFVFLPRVREVGQKRQQAPDGSMVAAYAVREMDGDPKVDQLLSLLSEFDALFGAPRLYTGPSAGGRRLTPVLALIWTVVAVGLGILLAGYTSRLAAPVRLAVYSFVVHEPASHGYESISLTASGEGRPGSVPANELKLDLYLERAPVPGGELTVDLATLATHYHDPLGNDRLGRMTPTVVVEWMQRCGVQGEAEKLSPEAAALVGFAGQVRQDPAGTFQKRRSATTATGEPFLLYGLSNIEHDRPGSLSAAIPWGAAAVIWLIGMGVIRWRDRRRQAKEAGSAA